MKKSLVCGAVALVLVSLTGCANQQQAADQKLASQTVMAVDWFQQSGEYRALAYQSFNSARAAWDQSAKQGHAKRAVIVDLDETMLDNSAYSAWQAKNNKPFDDKTWSQWTQARQALAVPGAVDFANYVNSHGGTMFYVSNRDSKDFDATVANMKALGFTGVSDKTVRLKTDSSNKQARFDAIKAEGYDVVMYIGDNLNDFGKATYHKDQPQRQQFASDNRSKFGTQFIVLPNPMYGDWEGALAPNYYKLNAAQQAEARENALRTWSGK